jgi:phage virion morphogenesis protein
MPKLTKLKDEITPSLAKRLRAAKDRKPILSRVGQTLKSLAQRAFTDSSLRPSEWAPRKKEPKKPHALLIASGMLRKSIRVTKLDNDTVAVGSDRPYAAAHQLGRDEINLPARPFLPFTRQGNLTPQARTNVETIIRSGLDKSGATAP